MSKPINLAALDVLELKQFGNTTITRAIKTHTDPDEMPAEQPHQAGDRLWGRESVARRLNADAPGTWLYKADGYIPGRFYPANYYMPREACRFELEVVAEKLEYIGNHWVAITQVCVVEPISTQYVVDFDKVAQAGRNCRHRPTFPLRVFDSATDATLRTHPLVREHERFHHDEWFLPLYQAHVRAFLKKVRFLKPPVISVGGVDVEVGKEAPAEVTA